MQDVVHYALSSFGNLLNIPGDEPDALRPGPRPSVAAGKRIGREGHRLEQGLELGV
jgi:hypothetical protein